MLGGNIGSGVSAQSASLSAIQAQPIKNDKLVRITKVGNGFLIEMQNVEDYKMTNNVAVDFDSASEIVKSYFAD